MMVNGNPLAVRRLNLEGLRRRGFSPERLAAIKQMHRLLPPGPDAGGRAQRHRRAAAAHPEAAADIAQLLAFLDTFSARHCPAESAPCRTTAPRRDGGGRGRRAICSRACCSMACQRPLAGPAQRGGIGGAQMAQRGFDAWWPSEKLAVHGYSLSCCAAWPKSS